jgi:class 3 adenylate cyclase
MEADFDGELRLFLEELCCELCRLRHVREGGITAEDVKTLREVPLSRPNAFADILVTLRGTPGYFVEIKYGLSLEETVRRIRRKYAVNHRAACNRLIVVVRDLDAAVLRDRLRDCVCSSLDIEIWDEARLLGDVASHFGIEIGSLVEANIIPLHRSILQANWRRVFAEEYNEILASALLWHFSPWTLKRLREQSQLGPADIWRPGTYADVAIVMGDICSFSAYVHDTPDEHIVHEVVTAFYSRSRHAVHECGGMLYQFVGDEVVGLFGFPDKKPGYVTDAVDCAKALLDIGASTSESWERRIDRVQDKHGLHIGIAMGELNLLPLRPFARSHSGFIGDALNVTARLMVEAQPGEIVVSNSFYQALDEEVQAQFAENQPVIAKNVGTLRSWRRFAGGCTSSVQLRKP